MARTGDVYMKKHHLENRSAGDAEEDPLRELDEMEDVGGIKPWLQDLGNMIRLRRDEGRSTDGLVNHFIFTGDPGTGKTSVARLMGKVLHAYGILSRSHPRPSTARASHTLCATLSSPPSFCSRSVLAP